MKEYKKCFFILTVCLFFSIVFRSEVIKADTGIPVSHYQTVDSVNIRSGPGEEYKIIGTLEAGVSITVFQEAYGWGKIYEEAGQGWVYLGNLECLDLNPEFSDSASPDGGNTESQNEEPEAQKETDDSSASQKIEGQTSDEKTDEATTVSSDQSGTLFKRILKKIFNAVGLDAASMGDSAQDNSADDESQDESGQDNSADDESQDESGQDNSSQDESGQNNQNQADSSDSGESQWTYCGPGWNFIDGTWRYGDSDGLQIYASNALYQAWNAISESSSDTEFYIVVDCTENEFYIFYGCKDGWVPIELWQCSTGRWDSPTIKGNFTVLDKGYSFGEPKYSCYYYTEFSTNYLFHSILYDAGTFDVQDDRLGENVSNGCVRLAIENAKWVYDNIPVGTAVYIY